MCPRVPRFLRRSPSRTQTGTDAASMLHDREREIVERASRYTMIGTERLIACIDAVDHVVRRNVPGAIAECGVWRGGAILAMILKLQQLGCTDREVYLFDTFEGMTEPTSADTSRFEASAMSTWQAARSQGRKAWDHFFRSEIFSLDQVEQLIYGTGYPREKIHFVVGPVETTLPEAAPERIALLRLDTDWYESTRHELEHLYPRLASGGILLVDDYGHWDGCRRAVDEYFANDPVFLVRIDYTGRAAVKP